MRMRYGPYPPRAANQVSEILRKAGVAHESEPDHDYLREQEIEWQTRVSDGRGRPEGYDPAFVFLEIDEEDLARVGPELERFGITRSPFEPRFDSVDYLCPKCRYYAVNDPDARCPRHDLPLLSEPEWRALRRARQERNARIAAALLLILAAFVTAVWLRSRLSR